MPSPRWLGRLATAGLVLVLLALTGFSLGVVVATQGATRDAERAVLRDEAYQRVAHTMTAAQAWQRQYALQRPPAARARFVGATDDITVMLQHIVGMSDADDQTTIARLLALQRAYRAAVRRFIVAVDAGNRPLAQQLNDQAIEPVAARMSGLVDEAAQRERAAADVALHGLDTFETGVRAAVVATFAVGLLLLWTFWAVLHAARRAQARSREGLHRSEQQLRAVVTHAPVVLFALDQAGLFTLSEGQGLASLGLAPGAVVGQPVWDMYRDHPDLLDHARRALDGETFVAHNRVADVAFETRWTPLRDANGRVEGIVGVSTDVTKRVRAEEALRDSEANLAEAQRIALLGNWWRDADSAAHWSDELYRIHGLTPGQGSPGERIPDLIHPEDRQRVWDWMNAVMSGREQAMRTDHRIVRPDGEVRHVHQQVERVCDDTGRVRRIVGIVLDITERKRMEEALRHQATHDALTGLPNRVLLDERLGAALAAGPLALLLLDLDRFKEVNDTFGHPRGDELLAEVAARLRGVTREADTVARLGGDEFAVLLLGGAEADARAAARAIRATLEAPIAVAGQPVQVGASIGVALAPAHGGDGATLLRRADVAMYAAKRAQSGVAVYDPAQDQHSLERLALVAELRHALAHGGLVLHYQPKANLASGQICGVEALARWWRPERGFIPPDHFIPLAEATGLMAPLTEWALEAALRQHRAWADDGLTLDVAVNLSMWSLHDPALPGLVATLLRRHGAPPERLCLEITESAAMADAELTAEVLGRLAALGVRLAVDDFGTGYSSLAYLARLPVHELKIDRGFARALTTSATDRTIVASTIGLGHGLGLNVVTEGVEDAQTWELLKRMGCDVAQGYYLSRPLPADELERWARRLRAVA